MGKASAQKVAVGQGMEVTVNPDGSMVILVNTKKVLGKSKSGKSNLIATTSGNVSVPGLDGVKLGLNIYRPL